MQISDPHYYCIPFKTSQSFFLPQNEYKERLHSEGDAECKQTRCWCWHDLRHSCNATPCFGIAIAFVLLLTYEYHHFPLTFPHFHMFVFLFGFVNGDKKNTPMFWTHAVFAEFVETSSWDRNIKYNFDIIVFFDGGCAVVGWGTAAYAGRRRARFPMGSLGFFIG